MKKWPYGSLLCVATAVFAADPAPFQTYTDGGMVVSAGFRPDAARILLGEPLFLTWAVNNRGEQPFVFETGGDNRGSVRHNNFHITATDAEGQPVKDPYGYNNFGGMGNAVTLAPGKEYKERLFLNHWCAFEKPGEYTVKCERTLRNYGPESPRVPVVTTFKLTVEPSDAKRMSEIISDWGRAVQTNGPLYEASLALSTIRDERAIPHLALALTKGDYQSRIPAIEGLTNFPGNASADALTVALKDMDHAVAERAAAALRGLKNVDRAVENLLPELADKNAINRAVTVRALGWTGSSRAFESLLARLQDDAPSVRNEAAQAIGRNADPRSLDTLKEVLQQKDASLRIAAVNGMLALKQSLQAEWLTPIIRAGNGSDPNFHEAIRLLRIYGGEQAAPGLVSCVEFDKPESHYNFWLMLAIEYSPDGPKYYYKWHHDPNRRLTDKEFEENRKILAELQDWLKDRKPN